MKKIALFLIYTLTFFTMLLFFTPKESLYYYAEEQLKPLGVVIGYEALNDSGFSLEIEHPKLFVQKIKSANIDAITLSPWLLYNHVEVENIILDSAFEQFFPPLINRISITQSILDPIHAHASSVGDFGEAVADIDLVERQISVVLKPSKLMRSRYLKSLVSLKKNAEGDYVYELQY